MKCINHIIDLKIISLFIITKKYQSTMTVSKIKTKIITPPGSPKENKTIKVIESELDDESETIIENNSQDIIQVFQSKLIEYNSKIAEINKQSKELQQFAKSLEKDFTIISKMVAKTAKKNKSDKPRPLSGFAVPSALTDELYDFLKIERGELVPRKDVTKLINEYIKDNNCRDDKDKRKIVPDALLKKLFNSTDEDKITYFNLQTFMKHHYIKN
jgi:chromatin remodeling complex protein RSC6